MSEMSEHDKAHIRLHFAMENHHIIPVWYWTRTWRKYKGFLRMDDNCNLYLETRHLGFMGCRHAVTMAGQVDLTQLDHARNPRVKTWKFTEEHNALMDAI